MRRNLTTKVSNFIKNKYFLLVLITFLALFIRLLNIDKPSGLWYDEMLTYIFSSKGSAIDIMKALLKEDFHMPLYYFFVGCWMKLFGTTDIALRLSSVFWGVLTIPAFFFLGKTYRDEKLGWFLSIIGCLSPIMIYYSQELRFYSILMFFSTLSIIFLLKLIEAPNKKRLFLFGASNLVILYIYTMGILFVGLEFLILLIHFYFYIKEFLKKFLKFSALFFVCSIPYFILLIYYLYDSYHTIIRPFAWGNTGIFSIFFLLNDWLSPTLIGQYGHNDSALKSLLSKQEALSNFISLSATTICFLLGFIKSTLSKRKEFIYLASILFSFLFIELILNIKGNLVIVTIYTLILLPIILLICSDGILQIKKLYIKLTCIILIIIIFVCNVIMYNYTPAFQDRSGGYKFATNQIKLQHLDSNYILYANRSELLKKYLPDSNFIDFDIPGILYLDKTKKEALKIFDEIFINTPTTENSEQKLIPYLLSPKPNAELRTYLNSQIKKIPTGKRLIYVDDFIIFNPEQRKDFIKKYQMGKISKTDFQEMFFYFTYAKICEDVKSVLESNKTLRNLGPKNTTTKSRWHFVIYEKIND